MHRSHRALALLAVAVLLVACQVPPQEGGGATPAVPPRMRASITPGPAVGFPGVDGGGGAVLPASGAFEASPTTNSTAGVAIPPGAVQTTLGWTATIIYTQGASSGQMSCKVFAFDGKSWGQLASPVDQSYSGIALGVGTGQYAISGTVPHGATRLMLVSAEVGVTATPGSYTAEIAFQ